MSDRPILHLTKPRSVKQQLNRLFGGPINADAEATTEGRQETSPLTKPKSDDASETGASSSTDTTSATVNPDRASDSKTT